MPIMDLTVLLFLVSLPFVLLTFYFGTKNDFYESDFKFLKNLKFNYDINK